MVIKKLWDKLERYKKCPYQHININMTPNGLLLSFLPTGLFWYVRLLLPLTLASFAHICFFTSMTLAIPTSESPPPTVPAIVTTASCLFRACSFPITLTPFSLRCQRLLRPTPSSGTMRPRDSCQHIVILKQAASAKN